MVMEEKEWVMTKDEEIEQLKKMLEIYENGGIPVEDAIEVEEQS